MDLEPIRQRIGDAAFDYCAATHEKRMHFANFLEIFRRDIGTVLYAATDGLLVRLDVPDFYFISATTVEAAQTMVALIDTCALICCREIFYLDLVEKTFGLNGHNICSQYAFDREAWDGQPFPIPPFEGEIRPLTQEHLPLVHRTYHDGQEDKAHLESLIDAGMLGLFAPEGNLAGFVGFHWEGSAGLLEVLPAYRRKGYGRVLELSALNYALLEMGQLYPFGQVVRGNEASFALQSTMPLAVCDATEMAWAWQELP